jgi:AbrB family looped-hinge helix DNA binding protein
MPVATLTSKGQLVIPKAIREYLRLRPGDRLDFIIQDNGEVVIRPAVTDVHELKGILKKPGRKPVSVVAMQKAIRQHVGRSVSLLAWTQMCWCAT